MKGAFVMQPQPHTPLLTAPQERPRCPRDILPGTQSDGHLRFAHPILQGGGLPPGADRARPHDQVSESRQGSFRSREAQMETLFVPEATLPLLISP